MGHPLSNLLVVLLTPLRVLFLDDESHRLDHVNFLITILKFQPNIVDELHAHGSPSVPQNMYRIFSQGGIVVSEIIYGDGLWHINRCPPSSAIQCFALQKKKGKINTQKTTFGTPVPCYSSFWVQFRFEALEHISIVMFR
jgi:hypothetical protein